MPKQRYWSGQQLGQNTDPYSNHAREVGEYITQLKELLRTSPSEPFTRSTALDEALELLDGLKAHLDNTPDPSNGFRSKSSYLYQQAEHIFNAFGNLKNKTFQDQLTSLFSVYKSR